MRTLLMVPMMAYAALAAPPRLVLPPEVRPAGQYVRLAPDTDGVSVTYVGLDGIDPFPSDELRNPRRFLLDTRGLKAGRYRFAAVAAGKDGEQSRADFAVVVGDVPPDPGPKPPQPVDPLVKAMRDAIASCPEPDRSERAARFAALYRQAPKLLDSETIKTAGDLADAMARAHAALELSGTMKPLQQVIQGELKKVLPDDRTRPYGDPARVKALFASLATAIAEATK